MTYRISPAVQGLIEDAVLNHPEVACTENEPFIDSLGECLDTTFESAAAASAQLDIVAQKITGVANRRNLLPVFSEARSTIAPATLKTLPQHLLEGKIFQEISASDQKNVQLASKELNEHVQALRKIQATSLQSIGGKDKDLLSLFGIFCPATPLSERDACDFLKKTTRRINVINQTLFQWARDPHPPEELVTNPEFLLDFLRSAHERISNLGKKNNETIPSTGSTDMARLDLHPERVVHAVWKERIDRHLPAVSANLFEPNDRTQALFLSNNALAALPTEITTLSTLKALDLSHNQFETIPDAIGSINTLERLSLSANRLTSIPESICALSLLEYLVLPHNQISTIPEAIGNLTHLKTLNLCGNQISSLPATIGNLTNLRSLLLAKNQLTSLPDTVGNLQDLSSLFLGHNRLTSLPASLKTLENLRTLDLSSNPLLPKSAVEPLSHIRSLSYNKTDVASQEKEKPSDTTQ